MSHLQRKRTHDENRTMVCYSCFNKATKSKFKVEGQIITLLEKIYSETVLKTDSCRPAVICGSCYIKIKQNNLKEVVDYAKFKILMNRNDQVCECEICQVARFNPCSNGQKAKEITLKHTIAKLRVGRPRVYDQTLPFSVKICASCNTTLQRGINHSCNKTQKIKNTLDLADSCKQQVASQILLQEESVQQGQGSSNLYLNKGRGLPMSVSIKRKREENQIETESKITVDHLNKMQIDCNLSTNTVKKITANIRKINKNFVESNVDKKLQEMLHSVDHFFDVSNHLVGYPIVYCSDLPKYLTHILNERKITENFHLRFGIDSGGGSLKICLSILIHNHFEELSRSKSSGIKKLHIIALAAGMTENYENVKLLVELLNLNTVCGLCSYTYAADLKMIMMLLGLQSNSSSYPCPWCEAFHKTLDQKGADRTIRSIAFQSQRWQEETKGDGSKAKLYKNCIRTPLLMGNEDSSLLEYIPPPELHLLMGVVQKIFDTVKSENADVAEKWLQRSKIRLDRYQKLNGNNAKSLLECVDILADLSPGNKYIPALEMFKKVVTSCFGTSLDCNYLLYIEQFKIELLKTKIPPTPKIHAVIFHVPEFIKMAKTGLGFYSEQASEQSHHSFKIFSQNYNLSNKSENFGNNLLRCVASYNAQHV